MADKQKPAVQTAAKRNPHILLSFLLLLVGFVAGVVFTSYRLGGSDIQSPMDMPPHAHTGMGAPAISAEHAEQLARLEKATEAAPDVPAGWVALGNAYFDHDMVDKAIAAYKKALAISPGNAQVWTDLGVMHRRAGNLTEALAAFDKASALAPSLEVPLFNKGLILMHDQNDAAGALAAWKKLLAVNPEARTPSGMLIKDLVRKLE